MIAIAIATPLAWTQVAQAEPVTASVPAATAISAPPPPVPVSQAGKVFFGDSRDNKPVTMALPKKVVQVGDEEFVATGTLKVSAGSLDGASTTAGTRFCKNAYVGVKLNNRIGKRLWSYEQEDRWCYDLKTYKIYSIQDPQRVGAYLSTLGKSTGWKYSGERSKWVRDYFGNKWVYQAWVEGEFEFCPIRVPVCVQSKYPQLNLYMYADAHYEWWWNIA